MCSSHSARLSNVLRGNCSIRSCRFKCVHGKRWVQDFVCFHLEIEPTSYSFLIHCISFRLRLKCVLMPWEHTNWAVNGGSQNLSHNMLYTIYSLSLYLLLLWGFCSWWFLLSSYAEMAGLAVEWEESRLAHRDHAEAYSSGGGVGRKDEGGWVTNCTVS